MEKELISLISDRLAEIKYQIEEEAEFNGIQEKMSMSDFIECYKIASDQIHIKKQIDILIQINNNL